MLARRRRLGGPVGHELPVRPAACQAGPTLGVARGLGGGGIHREENNGAVLTGTHVWGNHGGQPLLDARSTAGQRRRLRRTSTTMAAVNAAPRSPAVTRAVTSGGTSATSNSAPTSNAPTTPAAIFQSSPMTKSYTNRPTPRRTVMPWPPPARARHHSATAGAAWPPGSGTATAIRRGCPAARRRPRASSGSRHHATA